MGTDEELASALRRGDDEALASLYDRYRRPLYAFCARMLDEPDAARDCVQDVFVGLRSGSGVPAGLTSFRAWLFTLARNRCLNLIRQRATRARLAPVSSARPAAGAEAELEASERASLVRDAVRALPEELREALVLREYLDLSYREIADVVASSESAVKSRLFRARRALYESLEPLLHEGDTSCRARTPSRI